MMENVYIHNYIKMCVVILFDSALSSKVFRIWWRGGHGICTLGRELVRFAMGCVGGGWVWKIL